MESVDQSSFPGLEGIDGDGLDAGDSALDGLGHEGSEDELPQLGVVVPLVEEDGLLAQHPLFARRECGLEQVRLRHQHELGRLRARYHHAGTPQYVSLEYRAIPALFLCEEDVGVLGVELEGLAEVGPAEGARREGQSPASGGEEVEGGAEEEGGGEDGEDGGKEDGGEFHALFFLFLSLWIRNRERGMGTVGRLSSCAEEDEEK